MIRLSRKAETDPARARLRAKAARYEALRKSAGEVPASLMDAYRDAEVKVALSEESCGKCGYCESKILDAQFGDVEHIHPKALRADLRLEYENLVLACTKCNNRKNARYDASEHHIDPYVVEPSQHLLASGPFILRRPGESGLGRATEYVFELNRAELLESRRDRLTAIEALAEVYAKSRPGLQKRLARAALEDQAGQCGEYSMTVRAYLRVAFPDDGF